MLKNTLNSFAIAVLDEDLNKAGYTRIGTAWYKIEQDVILSVELRKLPYRSFDITFGILPFSCFENLKLNISYLQGDLKYWKDHKQYYIEKYGLPHSDDPRFRWSPDHTVRTLNDPNGYALLFEFWSGFYYDVIKPHISVVHDLQSALDSIGSYLAKQINDSRPKFYWPDHAPAFMKLGCPEKALPYLKNCVELKLKDNELDVDSVELLAKPAWQVGKLNYSFVWYWLIVNNDIEKMQIVVESNEQAAREWIKVKIKQ
ncbi:MAG: hypothetical protein IKZ82_01260 [Clostridia bacterium]|nr:hypothetical protein [Clostridia bacterium]